MPERCVAVIGDRHESVENRIPIISLESCVGTTIGTTHRHRFRVNPNVLAKPEAKPERLPRFNAILHDPSSQV